MSISASSLALAKLEPYLLLAKSARGAAAAQLIIEATAAPGCFVFSELLECQGIQELANDAALAGHYRLLELFAYGTMMDYHAAPVGTYPALSDAHLAKLRLLTLATLAANSRNLAYSTLVASLGVGASGSGTAERAGSDPSSSAQPVTGRIKSRYMRQIEDIVIDAIYSGILSARIDQQRQRLEVESVMGRDVRPEGGMSKMAQTLDEWSLSTTHVLDTLAARIEDAKRKEQQRVENQAEYDAKLEKTLGALLHNHGSAGNSGGGNDRGGHARQLYDRLGSDRNGDMDLDEDGAALRKKKSSSGGPLRSKRSRA